MIFVNDAWNDTGDIVVYSNYHKYWLDKNSRIKNPLFDVFSGKILDLKSAEESAIEYFYKLIDCEICKNVTVCIVPSSDAQNVVNGMTKLGEMLAANGRVDRVHFLRRIITIEKLAYGGSREKEVHMKSIGVESDVDISGEVVLLMDDVTTTGNSLYACRDILLANGAEKVEMFALGKAI